MAKSGSSIDSPSAAARAKAQRSRLLIEIGSGILGVLLGTGLTFAVSPARAADLPKAQIHRTLAKTTVVRKLALSRLQDEEADSDDQGGDADNDPEPVLGNALLTLTGSAPIPAIDFASLRRIAPVAYDWPIAA